MNTSSEFPLKLSMPFGHVSDLWAESVSQCNQCSGEVGCAALSCSARDII